MTPHVVVLTGQSVPRKLEDLSSQHDWHRAMLVLLKPWRVLSDLKPHNTDWTDAFHDISFGRYETHILHNFMVENKCEDARDNDLNNTNNNSKSLMNPLIPETTEGAAMEMDFLQQSLL